MENHQLKDGLTTQTSALSSFLQSECPIDLIPKIMSFAGHETVRNMTCCSKGWKSIIEFEGLVWKQVCTDTHKWSAGDEVPLCWKQHYNLSPCVPFDYSNISKAIDNTISSFSPPPQDDTKKTKIRVLIQPGKYTLNKSLVIQPPNHIELTIESLPIPSSVKQVPYHVQVDQEENSTVNSKISRRRFKKRKNMLSILLKKIRHRDGGRSTEAENVDRRVADHPNNDIPTDNPSDDVDSDDEQSINHTTRSNNDTNVMTQRQATLAIDQTADRYNRPIMDVRQGSLRLVNIRLDHHAPGKNIWAGNAALHIQPHSKKKSNKDDATTPPQVVCDSVDIRSTSGRGINLFGRQRSISSTTETSTTAAKVEIYNSYIHHCAATGLYVGEGQSHQIYIDNSDVMYNGHGNLQRFHYPGGGIGGGHSGICLQGGNVTVTHCHVSQNASTAILGLGEQPITLNVSSSDLAVSNHSNHSQIHMPETSEVTLSDDTTMLSMTASTTLLSNDNQDSETYELLRSPLAAAAAR